MRLSDADIAAHKEITVLRDENTRFKCEAETTKKQLRAQDEAIQGAHELKIQVDEMIVSYERLKKDQAH